MEIAINVDSAKYYEFDDNDDSHLTDGFEEVD